MEEKKTLENMETMDKKQAAAHPAQDAAAPSKQPISPTWAHECIEDLDDWIESQGIYLRQ